MSLSVDLLLAFSCSPSSPPSRPVEQHHVAGLGVNFGFVRSIPHILGISCGFFIMVMAVGFGLGTVFEAYPVLYTILRYVGAAYLLYLAWKIATSGPAGNDRRTWQAVELLGRGGVPVGQPKAWVMAVGAISTYTPLQGYFTNVVVISTVFALINAPTIGIWAGFGSMLRNVLRDPRWLRVFNVGMALLLVASLYPILAESHSA